MGSLCGLGYAVTKEVFDNLEQFKGLLPACQALTVEAMPSGMSSPVHPGALRNSRAFDRYLIDAAAFAWSVFHSTYPPIPFVSLFSLVR